MARAKIVAARLRHTICIQKTTETRTSSGEVTTTWTEFKTIRAAIEPLLGREYLESQQVNAEETVRFRIRYTEDLTTKMRILWGSRTYDIRSILNVGQVDKEMILMAVEDV